MDIECAKCGRHFNSVEAVRAHMHAHVNDINKDKKNEPLVHKPIKSLSIESPETTISELITCPNCRMPSLFYNQKTCLYECLNAECNRTFTNQDLLHKVPDISAPISPKVEQSKIFSSNLDDRTPTSKRNMPQPEVPKTVDTVPNSQVTSGKAPITPNLPRRSKKSVFPKWLIPLLFIFSLSAVGIGISIFVKIYIPFWIFLGFSIIFSVEKWFSYYTKKHKGIGKLYRLTLNVSILSLFGALVYSGILLFSNKLAGDQLTGSLIFVAVFVCFIWLWRVIAKNSWRWPSMKLTVLCLIGLLVLFGFAGVSPFSDYKDKFVKLFTIPPTPIVQTPPGFTPPEKPATSIPPPNPVPPPSPAPTRRPSDTGLLTWTSKDGTYYVQNLDSSIRVESPSGQIKIYNPKTGLEIVSAPSATTVQPPAKESTSAITTQPQGKESSPAPSINIPATPIAGKIDPQTGKYGKYFLGLVKAPDGYISGHCYSERFIVLINNSDAKNPTYQQLLNFLKADKTDEYPYKYVTSNSGYFYGQAEDKIDLANLKNIIDGKVNPTVPCICSDFAERLHNNAEQAGIRCGYVSLDMVGYNDPYNLGILPDAGHAVNIFETTDRGIIYIDDTGNMGNIGPANNDMTVDIQVGKPYSPKFLFPSGGWYVESGAMGKVTNVFVAWDGKWR